MRPLPTAIILTMLLAAPAGAFDAAGADIIGLRLGMTEPQIVARLTHQGFSSDRSPEGIDAKTLDGHLHIAMSADRGATEIVYVFDYGGKIVSAKIRDSIVTHFGDPPGTNPMRWCLRADSDGNCPEDQASLTYQPRTLTLMLRAAADPH